jgi:hypothetical protein
VSSLLGWWQSLVDWVRATYNVNPYVFIALYVISIPPYWWGLWDIARGIQGSVKTKSLTKKGLVARGIVINLGAWLLPYVYVAAVARHLPWYIWVLMAVVVTYSATLFVVRFRQRRIPARLPRFLRRRLTQRLVEEHASPPTIDAALDSAPTVVGPASPKPKA